MTAIDAEGLFHCAECTSRTRSFPNSRPMSRGKHTGSERLASTRSGSVVTCIRKPERSFGLTGSPVGVESIEL